jgi:hypothetical protein
LSGSPLRWVRTLSMSRLLHSSVKCGRSVVWFGWHRHVSLSKLLHNWRAESDSINSHKLKYVLRIIWSEVIVIVVSNWQSSSDIIGISDSLLRIAKYRWSTLARRMINDEYYKFFLILLFSFF